VTRTHLICQLIMLLTLHGSNVAAQETDLQGPGARDIGSRRELFVDRFLIDRLENATLKLHEPRLEPAMSEPADNLEYGTVIKDGDLFRLYTRDARGSKFDGDTTEVTRYCESRDGIHWTKPELGLIEILLLPALPRQTTAIGLSDHLGRFRDMD
jgi:hypothetical protein